RGESPVRCSGGETRFSGGKRRGRHEQAPRSRIETYKALSLFAGGSRSELRLVDAVTTRLILPRGTVLAQQGPRPSAFVILWDGPAAAHRDGQHVEDIGTGSHFGEISLVRGIREPATVIAQTDITVDVVGAREFRTL